MVGKRYSARAAGSSAIAWSDGQGVAQRLARRGRRDDDDVLAGVDGLDRLRLVGVQLLDAARRPGRSTRRGSSQSGMSAKVFNGPIKDNTGKELLPAGQKLAQSDLDQFPPGAPGSECKTCMYWWNDGITVELPKLSS